MVSGFFSPGDRDRFDRLTGSPPQTGKGREKKETREAQGSREVDDQIRRIYQLFVASAVGMVI